MNDLFIRTGKSCGVKGGFSGQSEVGNLKNSVKLIVEITIDCSNLKSVRFLENYKQL
jgi:hypothetical protein